MVQMAAAMSRLGTESAFEVLARANALAAQGKDIINLGNFWVKMDGYPNEPENIGFSDLPANYHNGSGTLSFADGHVETKRWTHPDTTPPLVKGNWLEHVLDSGWVNTPNNPDIIWLQQHTTRAAD